MLTDFNGLQHVFCDLRTLLDIHFGPHDRNRGIDHRIQKRDKPEPDDKGDNNDRCSNYGFVPEHFLIYFETHRDSSYRQKNSTVFPAPFIIHCFNIKGIKYTVILAIA